MGEWAVLDHKCPQPTCRQSFFIINKVFIQRAQIQNNELYIHQHLHLGHLADAFIQSDLQ